MANQETETWKYQGDTRHIDQKIDSLPESEEHAKRDIKYRVGRINPDYVKNYQKHTPTNSSVHKVNAEDKIYEGGPVYQNITDGTQKTAAGHYARARLDKEDIGREYNDNVSGQYLADNGTEVTPTHVTRYLPGYSKNRIDDGIHQTGDVDDSGKAPDSTTGPVFYEGNTQHFEEKNPYRVTTKEADDYIGLAANDLVGDSGEVIRDEDGNIIRATPRQNQKRRETQYELSKLSSNLLKSYDALNLNVDNFRNLHQGTTDNEITDNIHTDDVDNYKNARAVYQGIAQNLDYLNTDGKRKWSGTLKYDKDGNISFDRSNARGGIGQHKLFNTDPNDTIDYNSDAIVNSNATEAESPYYFNPRYSNYNIKVADEKSAVALAHTLRQFFDLQVLYYKKHVEILQVFQLLVIFFEKYNYSINSLMYVLEHMTKDVIKPKEGDPIEVPIPIDFTKSVIGMLADQKNMMNVISTFKSHLGMNQGGIQRSANGIMLPDDSVFLDSTHNVYADTTPSGLRYVIPNAYWFPTFHTSDGRPLHDTTFHVSDGNNIFFPRTEHRDNAAGGRVPPPPPPASGGHPSRQPSGSSGPIPGVGRRIRPSVPSDTDNNVTSVATSGNPLNNGSSNDGSSSNAELPPGILNFMNNTNNESASQRSPTDSSSQSGSTWTTTSGSTNPGVNSNSQIGSVRDEAIGRQNSDGDVMSFKSADNETVPPNPRANYKAIGPTPIVAKRSVPWESREQAQGRSSSNILEWGSGVKSASEHNDGSTIGEPAERRADELENNIARGRKAVRSKLKKRQPGKNQSVRRGGPPINLDQPGPLGRGDPLPHDMTNRNAYPELAGSNNESSVNSQNNGPPSPTFKPPPPPPSETGSNDNLPEFNNTGSAVSDPLSGPTSRRSSADAASGPSLIPSEDGDNELSPTFPPSNPPVSKQRTKRPSPRIEQSEREKMAEKATIERMKKGRGETEELTREPSNDGLMDFRREDEDWRNPEGSRTGSSSSELDATSEKDWKRMTGSRTGSSSSKNNEEPNDAGIPGPESNGPFEDQSAASTEKNEFPVTSEAGIFKNESSLNEAVIGNLKSEYSSEEYTAEREKLLNQMTSQEANALISTRTGLLAENPELLNPATSKDELNELIAQHYGNITSEVLKKADNVLSPALAK